MRGTRQRGLLAGAAGAILLLSACGGGDDGGDGADAPAEATEAPATETAETEAAAEPAAEPAAQEEEDGGGEAAAAGGPSGTITIDGTAHEVSGSTREFRMGADGKMEMIESDGDFDACTYQDGGNEGQVTILVNLSEDEIFYVNFGRPDGIPPSADYPTQGQSTDAVEAQLDGDRATGTADFTADGGPLIEFEFQCA